MNFTLIKNLSDKDFKYLSEAFNGEKLKLVRKKGIYRYEYFKYENEYEYENTEIMYWDANNLHGYSMI